MIEYLILKSDKSDIFILNQPYSSSQVLSLFKSSEIANSNLLKRYRYLNKKNQFIKFKNSLGLNNVDYDAHSPIKTYIKVKGLLDFDKVILLTSMDLDKSLKDDGLFHGDKNEWATVYVREAYALYRNNDIEIFGGRTGRNLGIINEYSLIFSNNSYPFDHYGFSVKNNKTKYSFYATRLNNIEEGIDLQGSIIENEITENGDTLLNIQDTKRYFAIQRLDFKVSDRVQGALSASTVYGGPNQSFEAHYINPLNVFYISQRNSRVQMNNLYQFNLLYRMSKGRCLYLDFLIDDIIVNNEEGYNGADYIDNRFGLILKYSKTDFLFDKSLFSATYSRIWNETYLSYRNFENYIFFNKGIGYPYNSYESIKFSFSNFNFKNLLNNFSFNFYQKGENELLSSTFFNEQIQEFPLEKVKRGLIFNIELMYIGFKKCDVSYSFSNNTEEHDITHKFKLVYIFQN